MTGLFSFYECLRDSPTFRARLEEEESNVDKLEQVLERITKSCSQMIDVGKNYLQHQGNFVNCLYDLTACFKDDTELSTTITEITLSLKEMNSFQTTLIDQASRTILKKYTNFIKSDIKKVRESRSHFEKISGDFDMVLLKNSSTAKSKSHEVEEMQNILAATRSCFRHTTLDYVNGLSVMQSRKKHEIVGAILSYMHACGTFYHQGFDLCQDLEAFLQRTSNKILELSNETTKLEKEIYNRHSLVTADEIIPDQIYGRLRMEGYLYKRTSNAFKTWHRRWFYLYENQLVYRKRSGERNTTIMEDDLRLCTVKPVLDGERRFCFEVLSPTKSHILQADSIEMYQAWVDALQKGIGAAIQASCWQKGSVDDLNVNVTTDQTSETSSQSSRLDLVSLQSDLNENQAGVGGKRGKVKIWEQLAKIPGNDKCCDCKQDNPKWASINLGITLCIECSGVHRNMGVHYSKVRSLTLDDWEPEIIKVMIELGNDIVNRIYEANVTADVVRASPSCANNIRELWIKSKYFHKAFIKDLSMIIPRVIEDESKVVQLNQLSPLTHLHARKWSVRKTRRRGKSRDKSGNATSKINEVNESIQSDDKEVLVIDIDVEPVKEVTSVIELSSDQESEDDGSKIDEEDISNLDANRLLYKASRAHNLPVMCKALALGADKSWKNIDDCGRTALHQAILSGSSMPCEYLLLNGAKINVLDNDRSTPLHLATEMGNTAQVCLLLKNRADQRIRNNAGDDPLDIAIRHTNADIVTLLRLGRLNEEIKDTEFGSTGDDTFNDVVKDFSQLAYSHPERLQRNSNTNVKLDEDK